MIISHSEMTPNQSFFCQNFSSLINHEITFNTPIKPYTSFRIGGPAEILAQIKNQKLFLEVIKETKKAKINITYLGSGTNILVSDQGIKGLTIKYLNQDIGIQNQSITASSAVNTAFLAQKTINKKMAGLEFFTSLPGSLGGAIYNNAHYNNHYISEHLKSILFFDGQKIYTLSKKECLFDYDQSIFFKKKGFILSATFNLKSTANNASLKQIALSILKYRQNSQPLNYPSAGCVFKNPLNNSFLKKLFPQFSDQKFISAGFLIDKANLKGLSCHDAVVSSQHAGFIINQGNAQAKDVLKLIKKIQFEIQNCFKINLETEIFYLT